jgi:hypothetical protein
MNHCMKQNISYNSCPNSKDTIVILARVHDSHSDWHQTLFFANINVFGWVLAPQILTISFDVWRQSFTVILTMFIEYRTECSDYHITLEH